MTSTQALAIRTRWGLTPREAATLLGVTTTTVCRWQREPAPGKPIQDPFWLLLLDTLDPAAHGERLRSLLQRGERARAYLYLLTSS